MQTHAGEGFTRDFYEWELEYAKGVVWDAYLEAIDAKFEGIGDYVTAYVEGESQLASHGAISQAILALEAILDK